MCFGVNRISMMRVKEVCRQEANSEDWVSAEVDLEMGSKSSGFFTSGAIH